MSRGLRTALLTAGIVLNVHAILRARRLLADTFNVDGDPDGGCGTSWCPCNAQPDDETGPEIFVPEESRTLRLSHRPCPSRISLGGGYICDKPVGHDGLHAAGGYRWTEPLGDVA